MKKESSVEKDHIDFNEVLHHVGQFGPWQKKLALWLWIVSAINGLATLAYAFVGYVPRYRCAIPYCEDVNDASYYMEGDSFANYVVQGTPESSMSKSTSCQVYSVVENSNSTSPLTQSPLTCASYLDMIEQNDSLIETQECQDIVFDTTYVLNSIVTEYDLTCGDKHFKSVIGAIYMVGLMVGSLGFGIVSDHFGRMKAMMLGIAMTSLSGVLGAFMPTALGFAICRFVTGVGAKGLFMVAFVLTIEYTGPKYLAPLGIALNLPFAMGELVLGLEAYFIRDWFALQIVAYAPILATMLLWFVIPESPRWLIAKGRSEEAREIIRKGAVENHKSVPQEVLAGGPIVVEDGTKKPTFKDTLWPPVILGRSLNMYFQWFSVTFCYYGLSYGSTTLLGDLHTNFFLNVCIEFPGYLFALVVMNCWGRRPILAFCQVVAGVGCIFAGLLVGNDSLTTLQVCLSLLGKFGASASFSIVYQYTAEMFPTAIRTTAVGNCSTVARFGAIAALLVDIMADIWGPLPMVLMGSIAVTAGCLGLLLPETAGLPLPETVQEAIDIGKRPDKRGICTCTCPRSCADILVDDS